jgi:hypothetical protein
MMKPVYARDGSAEFNAWLHNTLLRIADDVERVLGADLTALILGGGYGRGEGGVVHIDGKEMPYNDFDFTLITTRKTGLPLDRLAEVCAPYARELGIHVDFSRPLTLRDVKAWPHWLVWHDLLNGHVALKGPEDVLRRHAPEWLNEPLPPVEAAKLLLNRGTGVLWALRVVRQVEPSPDPDFVRRNHYKCALSLGDALLICFRRYTVKYSGRDEIFEELERNEPRVAALDLSPLYKEALRFKFRPDLFASDMLTEKELCAMAQRWGRVFLLVEQERTGRVWKSLDEYVAWRGVREPAEHTLTGTARNIVRNAQMGMLSRRYPREALYRKLPVLLGLSSGNVKDWARESHEYLRVWDRFN